MLAPPPVASVRGGTVQYYPNAEKMRRAQREIAEQLGVFQLDFDEVVKNEGGKASWLERELSQRDLHLTARGYSRLAEIFYKKLVSQVQACK